MLDALHKIDQTVPLWELLVIGLALLAIALVLILWWAFGYNLVVVTHQPDSMQPVSLAAALL